jgi:hypothetical protein
LPSCCSLSKDAIVKVNIYRSANLSRITKGYEYITQIAKKYFNFFFKTEKLILLKIFLNQKKIEIYFLNYTYIKHKSITMWSSQQKLNSKNVSCCSFCRKPGHKINKCSDQALDTLLQEAEEASIVGFILFWEWNPNKSRHPHEFVKFWLQNISDTELKILAYQFKIKPVPAESIELLPLQF